MKNKKGEKRNQEIDDELDEKKFWLRYNFYCEWIGNQGVIKIRDNQHDEVTTYNMESLESSIDCVKENRDHYPTASYIAALGKLETAQMLLNDFIYGTGKKAGK